MAKSGLTKEGFKEYLIRSSDKARKKFPFTVGMAVFLVGLTVSVAQSGVDMKFLLILGMLDALSISFAITTWIKANPDLESADNFMNSYHEKFDEHFNQSKD